MSASSRLFRRKLSNDWPLLTLLAFFPLLSFVPIARAWHTAAPHTLAERVQQLYEPDPTAALKLTCLVGVLTAVALYGLQCFHPLPLKRRIGLYAAGACFTYLSFYLTIAINQVPAELLQASPLQYSLELGYDTTFSLIPKPQPPKAGSKSIARAIVQPSLLVIHTGMSQSEFALWASQVPELATRWGYDAPAPQPPRYTSGERGIYLAWRTLSGLFLLLYLRLPLYWLWHMGVARRCRKDRRPSVEPIRPVATATLDF